MASVDTCQAWGSDAGKQPWGCNRWNVGGLNSDCAWNLGNRLLALEFWVFAVFRFVFMIIHTALLAATFLTKPVSPYSVDKKSLIYKPTCLQVSRILATCDSQGPKSPAPNQLRHPQLHFHFKGLQLASYLSYCPGSTPVGLSCSKIPSKVRALKTSPFLFLRSSDWI